ncbi:hypothetical protein [Sphingomonas sp. S2M10]|uniref:hypothetical protein n=1 Tax=Sphingomonas sp. S2M10 TaxID=2705010 RepID=UPI001FFD7465|nr:hypothetical protein [Sphingomonas sp. S2M10]
MRSFALHALLALPFAAHAQQAVLFEGRTTATIVHDDATSAKLAGELLARDIGKRAGKTPLVAGNLAACGKLCVVIGQKDSVSSVPSPRIRRSISPRSTASGNAISASSPPRSGTPSGPIC